MTVSTSLSESKRLLLQKQLSGEGFGTGFGPVTPRAADEAIPISAEQKDVWLHAQMAPDVPLYNESITIHRRGPFDRAALEASLREIIRRHEAWRTAFEPVGGELRQVVHAELNFDIPFTDVSRYPLPEREAAALELAAADARKPFDLSRPPLLRARIVRMAADEHRLYLTLHHIIFDGVSIYRIVVPELASLYATFARGREPKAVPRLQYGDYAIWREQRIAEGAFERELLYWRRQLAGELRPLRLPADRPHPVRPTHRGSMKTFQLSEALTEQLKLLARNEGVTLYVVLLAAFKALLHRLSGQTDIVIGGVTDMRHRPELANVVGYFLNSIALRTRPGRDFPFRKYLRDVQNTVVSALDASSIPFDRVVRAVQPRRRDGTHPIFQILFSMEPPPPSIDPNWDLTQMDVAVGAAKFDLYLELDERPDGLIGRFLYSRDVFDPPRINAMIADWTALLEAAAENPQLALKDLPLPSQRMAGISGSSVPAKRISYPDLTVPAWFEQQVRKTPDAIALEFNGDTFSYRDLLARVDALASRLCAHGVGPECLVGVMLERSPAMVVTVLAILKAGGAYLPLDPQLPPARLAMLVEDAQPRLVLSDSAHAQLVPGSSAKTILVDVDDGDDATAGCPTRATPDGLAYVLFTSGSTGKPKAVEICHSALTNLLAAMRDELQLGGSDVMLAVTTLSFDIAALELYLPLVTGGKLVLAMREDKADPVRLKALVDASAITIMQATPATWRALISAGWKGKPELKILCGGEALQPELARALTARCGRLWNMYGPTETTIWSLMHAVRAGEDPVLIGKPIANTSVHILDEHDEPVPPGVAGELYIGGAGVARGYRNEPVLTERKFRSLPAISADRLYRTGDRARMRTDGQFEFLGRVDNQVKIRGYRVGIEEVEAAISAHPNVAAAAVRTFADASGELSLAAFFVPKTPSGNDVATLHAHLERILPAYMIPARCTVAVSLPMTPNGKVDRAKLPLPQEQARSRSELRDGMERSLAEIWMRLLGLSAVDRNDNFFDLGGHSLLAVMLAAEIRERMNRELPLAELFRAPTIATQAELLRSAHEPGFSHLVPLRAEGAGRPLFVVHGIFGNVLQLRELAGRIRADRPVYALQARGADLRQRPHETMDEMAAAYVDAVRTLQPRGPYALAGYSFGGLVAFEMAARLREAGEDVELLALIETDIDRRNMRATEWLALQASTVRRALRRMTELPARDWLSYLGGKVAVVWRRLVWRRDLIRELDDPSLGLPEPVMARNNEMFAVGIRQFREWKPRAYAGKISVFRTARPRDPLPLWRRIAERVDIFNIAGAHGTIMESPNVDSLALQLDRCLAGLEASRDEELQVGFSPPHRAAHISAQSAKAALAR